MRDCTSTITTRHRFTKAIVLLPIYNVEDTTSKIKMTSLKKTMARPSSSDIVHQSPMRDGPPVQHEGYPFPPPYQYGFPVHGGYGGVFQPYPYPDFVSRKRSRAPANEGLYEYNYPPSHYKGYRHPAYAPAHYAMHGPPLSEYPAQCFSESYVGYGFESA